MITKQVDGYAITPPLQRSQPRLSVRELVRRALREPLLHFLLIGAALFALYGRGHPASRPEQVIEVTPAIIESLKAQYSPVQNRELSAEELSFLVEEYVREEVLYREAISLGLDQDDTVIRQRLRLKMEFISESAAASMTPDEAQLRSWFEENKDRFAPSPSLSFRQIAFDDPTEATVLLAALASGADPESLGRVGLLPFDMEAAPAAAIDGTFGPGFSDMVSDLPRGEWRGPVVSAYGYHLVVLDAVGALDPPSFDAVRDQVEDVWRGETAAQVGETQYQALRSRYQVVLPSTEPPR